jgi:hypothetical protein
MTYTANEHHCGGVYRDGVAIAFTRGDDAEAPAEARRIAAALNNAEAGPLSSFDFALLADALDCLDPDGSEATRRKQELEAWARQMSETGRGYLPAVAPCNTPPIDAILAELQRRRDAWAAMSHTVDGQNDLDEDEGEQLATEYDELLAFVRGLPPCNTPPTSPYSAELAEAFRQGARELQIDRLDIEPDAIVEEGGDGGAYVRCRVYVSDGERLPMPGEEIDGEQLTEETAGDPFSPERLRERLAPAYAAAEEAMRR